MVNDENEKLIKGQYDYNQFKVEYDGIIKTLFKNLGWNPENIINISPQINDTFTISKDKEEISLTIQTFKNDLYNFLRQKGSLFSPNIINYILNYITFSIVTPNIKNGNKKIRLEKY